MFATAVWFSKKPTYIKRKTVSFDKLMKEYQRVLSKCDLDLQSVFTTMYGMSTNQTSLSILNALSCSSVVMWVIEIGHCIGSNDVDEYVIEKRRGVTGHVFTKDALRETNEVSKICLFDAMMCWLTGPDTENYLGKQPASEGTRPLGNWGSRNILKIGRTERQFSTPEDAMETWANNILCVLWCPWLSDLRGHNHRRPKWGTAIGVWATSQEKVWKLKVPKRNFQHLKKQWTNCIQLYFGVFVYTRNYQSL